MRNAAPGPQETPRKGVVAREIPTDETSTRFGGGVVYARDFFDVL